MSETHWRVAVAGAAGRMGREVTRAIAEAPDMTLAAAIDPEESGTDAGTLAGIAPLGVRVTDGLAKAIAETLPDVLVDFTEPDSVLRNALTALESGVSPVIGTTGLTQADLNLLAIRAEERALGALVAPNFAIGAVLMMQFAAQAARYLPDVEIIELHHDRKRDSPSGTALLTAWRIDEARREAGVAPAPLPDATVQKAPGARGACGEATAGIPVHSVRLPGFVAHQEVLFGGPGQILTLRHDSLDRRSFMPGVLLAVRRVKQLPGLVVGLEHLLL